MSRKIHPVDFAEPQSKWPVPMLLPCKTELASPTVAFSWDDQIMAEPLKFNSLRDCRKCWEALGDGRYVYGVTERSVAMERAKRQADSRMALERSKQLLDGSKERCQRAKVRREGE